MSADKIISQPSNEKYREGWEHWIASLSDPQRPRRDGYPVVTAEEMDKLTLIRGSRATIHNLEDPGDGL